MIRPILRKAIVLGLGTALCIGAAGCASNGSSGSPSGVTSLVVYSADPVGAPAYKSVLDDFGVKNHVSIQLISYPSANFIQQFSSAVNGKSQIDALIANGQDVRYLQSKGLVGSLGDSINTGDLIPAAYEPFMINKNLYAVGIGGVNVTAFIYNQAIFDKYGLQPPRTVDDLIAIAQKLKGTDVAPVSVPGATTYLWPMWMMQMLQQTTNNTPTQTTFSTLQTGSPSFDSPEYTAALAEMGKLGAGDVFANGWQGLKQDAAVSLFSQGKAAMFFGGSWDIGAIVQQAPQMDIKAFAFPNFVPGVTSTAFGGAGVAAATYGKINSSHKALTDELVAYLSSAAVDKQLLGELASIMLPTVKSVAPPTQNALQTQLVKDFLPTESTFLDWYWPKQVTAAFQQDMVGVVAGSKTASEAAKDVQAAFVAEKANGYKFN